VKNGKVAIALVVLLAAIVVGLVAQMSDQTVAVLGGAACGIGLAGPLGFALGVLIGMSRARSAPTQAPSPPQVIVVPPQASQPTNSTSGYLPAQGAYPPLYTPARSFTIIGDEDIGE
jgi:hypothetical protein